VGRMHGEHKNAFAARLLAKAIGNPGTVVYALCPDSVRVPVMCPCGMREYPHELSVHSKLAWDGDWRCLWPKELLHLWRRP
jgi:hypothetical protein